MAFVLVGNIADLSAQVLTAQDLGRDGGAALEALQNMSNNPYESEVELDENGNPIEKPEEKIDSTKMREIKPLESYFFGDSIRRQKHFVWNVDTYANHIKMKDVDTLLNDFNVDYPFLREDVGDSNVGILGGVSQPLNFFRRPSDQDFIFTDGYYSYIFTPENALHYNNKRPYTILAYQTAGQKRYAEDRLQVVHAQNITPSTGFNISYNNQHSRGIYTWQRGKVTDLSAAIYHTGKRYSVHAGVVNNTISQRENGGLVEAWHITDTLYESAQGLPMKMADALNKANNTGLYAVQSFAIPFVGLTEDDFTIANKPVLYVGHAITYNRWNRAYTDTRAGTTYKITDRTGRVVEERNFYDHWYIDPAATNDSLSEKVLSNRLFVQLQPYNRLGVVGTVDGGIGWDRRSYYQFHPDDYLTGTHYTNKDTYYAYADARGQVKKYLDWHGFMRYNVGGYRAGDVKIDADATMRLFIKGKPLELSGRFAFESYEPSYWSQDYFSNHFVWSNNFNKQNRTDLDINLSVPHIGAQVGFKQTLLGNTVYYGADALPSQMMGTVSVTGLYLNEHIALGGLHLDHRLLLQHSSDQSVAPVPLLSARISYYYAFSPVGNHDTLTMKVGIDGWYNTSFHAPAYNPATMMFYNQQEAEIGGYPYFNVFVTAKWKTVRIFVQYQHANENLYENNKASFSVPYYPYNRALIKYGLSWYFDN